VRIIVNYAEWVTRETWIRRIAKWRARVPLTWWKVAEIL